jgi:hypothetical protein
VAVKVTLAPRAGEALDDTSAVLLAVVPAAVTVSWTELEVLEA